MPATWFYILNVVGLSFTALMAAEEISQNWEKSRAKIAVLQAYSWKDRGLSMYDPFEVCSDLIQDKRKKMKRSPLDFKNPSDVCFWWRLRELILVDLNDKRITMEMLMVLCISLSLALSLCVAVTGVTFGRTTAVCALTVVIMPISILFQYRALTCASDVNRMFGGHPLFIHRTVAELKLDQYHDCENRPRAESSMDICQDVGYKMETHESLLLELAKVIEAQPLPETIASFTVTPQLVVIIIFVMAALLLVNSAALVHHVVIHFLAQ